MRKLIAVLVLSIVITGMAYAPAEPLEPPTVSIGDLLLEDVATAQSASVGRSHVLIITAEQSASVSVISALVGALNDGALYHNGSPAGCNLLHGTDPSLLRSDSYILYDGGMILRSMIRYNETEFSVGMFGALEVAGPSWPSRCRAGWGALT